MITCKTEYNQIYHLQHFKKKASFACFSMQIKCPQYSLDYVLEVLVLRRFTTGFFFKLFVRCINFYTASFKSNVSNGCIIFLELLCCFSLNSYTES